MSQSPQPPSNPSPMSKDQGMDAAQQSLADALRVSFNVLKFIMVLLMIVYIFSGFFRVDSQNRAVRLRFGQQVGQSEYAPGWHFGLPYPLEEVIQVPINDQSLRIDKAFWYDNPDNRTPEQLAFQPIDPLKDGFLITGDTSIIHVQFEVTYSVTDVGLYVENVGSIEKAEEIVSTAAERGMLHTVASLQIDSIVNGGQYPTDSIKTRTQEVLTNLNTGIRVQQVLINRDNQSMPPAVRDAYLEVTNAQADKATTIESARQGYNQSLSATAGDAHDELYDLIRAYDNALQREDQALAELLRSEINRSFTELRLPGLEVQQAVAEYLVAAGEASQQDFAPAQTQLTEALQSAAARSAEQRNGPRITGEVASRINEALAYQTIAVNQAEQRYQLFQSYIDEYKKYPRLIAAERWHETREKIFSGMVETIYSPTGDIRVIEARDPETVQEMSAYELEQRRQRAQENRANQNR